MPAEIPQPSATMFYLYAQINSNYAVSRNDAPVERFAVGDPPQEVLDRIAKLDEEIVLGVKELEGMLK